ncbi:peptidase M61 [Panacibacter sp. DH6]|uniref:Peptidase M61 n=1 Tax=Panacibacter microcysteis TaxID=2793269 RepID=A0A931E696_9BACT|nr:peptidase M61 [Panacibacter microcysteis]MBG9377823.1 peptidase M61 [Panacibacter microcysteis]
MKKKLKYGGFLLCVLTMLSGIVNAQDVYKYSVDLTKVDGDKLAIKLECPKIDTKTINFYLPKIVPGTYMNSNYGKYIQDLKAYDKNGKELAVTKLDDNGWTIRKANKLSTITYLVEDTWDATIDNMVYPMCGTSFEAGKNFIINTPGLFGYFEGLKKMPFQLAFTKPSGFYAATGLRPVETSNTMDLFQCDNADHLYDSPIMFSLPDTTTLKVGNADVLVAVYSPHKLATSKFLAANLEKLLLAARDYLSGKLPVDKYAFIYYFNGEQKKSPITGAWEHSYSSFYALDEQPEKDAIEHWVDISSHEFFHIVTPLTISSREVKEFNFNETVLSKHLWLYEGSTEYYAHHVQAYEGLKTPAQFLNTLSQKITVSRSYYNDTLAFTELSKESAGKWAPQYGNVYQKGALISACLDLYLLKLSNAQYMLKDLKHDLAINYGTDKFFEDDSLFGVIKKLTYPEIGSFLDDYVAGTKPIPYDQFFSMAGIEYIPKETFKEFTIGGVAMMPTAEGNVKLGTKNMNDVGKKLGYKDGDELVSINNVEISLANLEKALTDLYASLKEGDELTIKVKRKSSNGEIEVVTLSGTAAKVEKSRANVLKLMNNPTEEQLKIRNAWLNSCHR